MALKAVVVGQEWTELDGPLSLAANVTYELQAVGEGKVAIAFETDAPTARGYLAVKVLSPQAALIVKPDGVEKAYARAYETGSRMTIVAGETP